MSFYIYYGKLDNELLVTILPNGTIEAGDPIHLFTQKRFLKLAVREVTTSSDGEDLVSFKDGYQSYKAVPKKGYKELDLTVKNILGKSSQVTLTRHYEQPITAISPSDPPKIWTGALNFHKWAKNESFVVIAPKGLGNDKPIVALWQWTENDKGVAHALCYSTDKQVSAKGAPGVFSFKQEEYYTLSCKVDEKTSGLEVAIKGPTNAEVVQKALALSAKVELGGEHRFTPPRSVLQKMELECSYPTAKPSLPRITGQLPFPADLVQTLSYSAAFVDQAGSLAQYAVKQFNDLEKAYRVLDTKAEARGAKMAEFKAEVTKLGAANATLTTENTKLKKELLDAQTAAAKAQKELQDKLNKALVELEKQKAMNMSLDQKNKDLEKYIDADKLADIAREKKWKEHDKIDHDKITGLKQELEQAQQTIHSLQMELVGKNLYIAGLEATLETRVKELNELTDLKKKLEAELAAEKTSKAEVQNKLDAATMELNKVQGELEDTKEKLADEAAAHKKTKNRLEVTGRDFEDLKGAYGRQEKQLELAEESRKGYMDDAHKKNLKIRELEPRLVTLQVALDAAETALDEAKKKKTSPPPPVKVEKSPVQVTSTEIVV